MLNLAKLTDPQVVFTQITLSSHRTEDFSRFEAAARSIVEVREVHLVSGNFDYLVKFMTSGIAEYQAIIEDLLEKNLAIAKYFSFIVLKSPL
ncbi:AsnC family protein [Collimonas sp. OK307]|uniref:Lrp/AsnC family transcriptional regulator n=1 Tax=Collimonas sp. OK307 TaxID=1801620 RepID=UPI0008DFAF87|nr:Lrp/AsnC family transcriptional regulator [Collimonas sp. OK307]SFH72074.1 AsnC family protein [Collimonas sp. OK307]